MNDSQTGEVKPKDLRSRIQARAKLQNQIQPEITPIYGKKARALASTSIPDTNDLTSSPTRNPFLEPKSFFGASDNLTDISAISSSSPNDKDSPLKKENEPLVDRRQSKSKLLNPKSESGDTAYSQQSKTDIPFKLVSRRLFGLVSTTLLAALIGSIAFQVLLMQKVNQLESRTSKVESFVSGNGYDDTLIQARLSANINKTDTLENVTIPGIQSNLSANIDTTDNLENVVIPGIQSDLAANIATTDNLENVVIPGIQSDISTIQTDLSANIAETDNIENVVIPGIQSSISTNTASINTLTNTVIPGVQSDISANTAQINTISNTIIPGVQSDISTIQTDLSVNIADTDNIENVVIPSIQSSISTNTASINTLTNTVIPGIQTSVSSNTASINTLTSTVIPGIQSSISTNTASINTLTNTVIPGIQSSVSTNTASINTLTNTVIPGIQNNVSTNTASILALQALIKKVPKFYYGITPTSAWQVYTSFGIVQHVDISSYGFVNPPIVITSLGGFTSHWVTVGASSVYGITKNQFTVYIRWADGANSTPLAPSDAASMGWQLQYALFSTDT